MTPTHANKQGRRYRYYVSRALVAGPGAEADPSSQPSVQPPRRRTTDSWRLPAAEIETLVIDAVHGLLIDQSRLMKKLGLGQLRPDALDAALAAGAELADALKRANGHEQRDLLQGLVGRIEIASEEVSITIRADAVRHDIGVEDDATAANAGLLHLGED